MFETALICQYRRKKKEYESSIRDVNRYIKNLHDTFLMSPQPSSRDKLQAELEKAREQLPAKPAPVKKKAAAASGGGGGSSGWNPKK